MGSSLLASENAMPKSGGIHYHIITSAGLSTGIRSFVIHA